MSNERETLKSRGQMTKLHDHLLKQRSMFNYTLLTEKQTAEALIKNVVRWLLMRHFRRYEYSLRKFVQWYEIHVGIIPNFIHVNCVLQHESSFNGITVWLPATLNVITKANIFQRFLDFSSI